MKSLIENSKLTAQSYGIAMPPMTTTAKDLRALLEQMIIVEHVDCGNWVLEIHFGNRCDDMRTLSNYLRDLRDNIDKLEAMEKGDD